MVVALVANTLTTDSGNLGGDIAVPKGAGVVDGLFLVALIGTSSGSGSAPAAGSGWSAGPLLDADCRIEYKWAASEGSTWAWVVPGAANGFAMVAGFSGVDRANPFGDCDFVHTTTTGDAVLPSVDATAETLYSFQMVAKAITAANTWTPPGSVTEDADGTIGGSLGWKYAAGHETLSVGASGTRSWDPSNTGSNQLFGTILTLRDAALAGGGKFLGLL